MSNINESIQNAIDEIFVNTYTNKHGEYNPNGVRSGKQRTGPFHEAIIVAISNELKAEDGYTFICEHPITDCYNKKFKVDVAAFKNGILHTIILVKAVNGDYNRNRNNYMNTMHGEALRVYAGRPDGTESPLTDVNVLFLNFIPTIQADYDRHVPHKLLRYQYVKTCDGNHVLSHISPNVKAIDLMFNNHVNINDAANCKSEKREVS